MLCKSETDKVLKKVGELSLTAHMKNKRIWFFGDTNKVMEYNLQTSKWTIKTLNTHSDFLYYSAAVTLPNGDALIIGGGSSTVVYQFTNKGELIKRKPMNQMRKEHSAAILGNTVYVMGGYDGILGSFLSSCELYNWETNKDWKMFAPMITSKCAFSACIVGKYIYTFGGYDGSKRLDIIEKYNISKNKWEEWSFKLRFSLSNWAWFSPFMNKVVIFGGGFSSGFSHFVEMIDVEIGEWKGLPKMKEGRDLRNKVVYIDGWAYAIGGLNRKCEKLNLSKNKWITIDDYIINDNLDSWSCALMFTPQTTFSEKDIQSLDEIDDEVEKDEEDDIELMVDAELQAYFDDEKEEMLDEEII